MPFTPAIPVAESEVGIAIEATRGTPVNPVYWLPTMGPKYKPNVTYLPDNTLQGSMVTLYDMVPSLRYDSHGWDSYLYGDSLGVYTRCLMGSSDNLTSAPANTTLASSASAGATTISTAASIPIGSYIVVDPNTSGLLESHITTNVSGAGPFTVTLSAPLAFAHNNSVAVTGLNKHQFSLLNNAPATGNQPPSATITDFDGETNWRQLPNCQLNGLNISGTADSLPKLTVDWMSFASATPGAPTPSFTATEAPVGWTSQLAIGGTYVGIVMNWEFDFKRNVKPVPAITGTQNYAQMFAGPLEVTGRMTVLADLASTWLNVYTAGTTEAIDLFVFDVKNGYGIDIHSSQAKFTSGEIDRSKDWVEIPLEVRMIPTTTDALAGGKSPCILTVANAQTTAY